MVTAVTFAISVSKGNSFHVWGNSKLFSAEAAKLPEAGEIELFGGWEQFVVLPRAPLKGNVVNLRIPFLSVKK